jgi:hypothetical protein
VENRQGDVVHLVAESSEALIRLVGVQLMLFGLHLVLFGLFAGKRLEVVRMVRDGLPFGCWALPVLTLSRFCAGITCANV